MHVCLLWGGECLPSLYLSSPSLQLVCVSLAGQLYHGTGPVHPGWGICLLLLGPKETEWHPRLPALLLFLQSHTVWQNCATRWHYCITKYAQFIHQARLRTHTCSNVHCFFFYSYHTGSLAFGSLILSLVQMIRVVLEYLDHKLKGDLCNLKNSLADFIVSWWWMLLTDWQVLTMRALDFCSAASNAASGAWNTALGSLTGMRTLW